jgi:hypothetical protein
MRKGIEEYPVSLYQELNEEHHSLSLVFLPRDVEAYIFIIYDELRIRTVDFYSMFISYNLFVFFVSYISRLYYCVALCSNNKIIDRLMNKTNANYRILLPIDKTFQSLVMKLTASED